MKSGQKMNAGTWTAVIVAIVTALAVAGVFSNSEGATGDNQPVISLTFAGHELVSVSVAGSL